MKVALVCIAKNEDNYIEEWINYHKKIGFDDIFIYQNDWRYVNDHPNVIKIEFDGVLQQENSYNEFLKSYKSQYNWAMFLDVDEFLVLHKHNNIKDFLEEYKDHKAVAICWANFGDNGHTNVVDDEYSVIKRFTKRDSNASQYIKSIVNLSYDFHMAIHFPVEIEMVDTKFNKFDLQNIYKSIEIAQINHYFCKTYPEFIQKIERGRADSSFPRTTEDFFKFNNSSNEVEDLSAYNFYYKKENIIQIGCNVGNDHVLEYVKKNKKDIDNLILVDANYKCIEECKKNYSFFKNIKTFNCAIVSENYSKVDLFIPNNSEVSQQSSIIEDHVLNHFRCIGCDSHNKIEVDALNINDFLKKLNLTSIDRLYIDIEGMDADVVSSIDYKKFKIKYLEFEHFHSDGTFSNFYGKYICEFTKYKKCLDILYSFGYNVTKNGINTIAHKIE